MNYKKVLAFTFGGLALLCTNTMVFGQSYSYEAIVGIPGVQGAGNFDSYIDALYALSISLAALIAVIKIVIAGAKYMLSDLISTKSDAKEDIKNSLIGLLIIIAAVIILNTINSDLTNLTLFDISDQINVDDSLTTPQLTMQAFCDEAATLGEPCEYLGCNDEPLLQAEPFLNPTCSEELSCKTRCEALGGRFQDKYLRWDEGCYDISLTALDGMLMESAYSKAQAYSTNNPNVIGVNCTIDDGNSAQDQCMYITDPESADAIGGFNAGEACREECLEDRQSATGPRNQYDEEFRVCIMNAENAILLTEVECNFYEEFGYIWGNGICTQPNAVAEDLTFSTTNVNANLVSQTDLNRLSNNANQTIALTDIESVLFLNYDDFSTETTEDALATELASKCQSREVYHDLVGSPGGNPRVGFYCLK